MVSGSSSGYHITATAGKSPVGSLICIFPSVRLQFCDSAKHHGCAKEKAKDAAIDARLAKIGVPRNAHSKFSFHAREARFDLFLRGDRTSHRCRIASRWLSRGL